jgi:hypothetical protein
MGFLFKGSIHSVKSPTPVKGEMARGDGVHK